MTLPAMLRGALLAWGMVVAWPTASAAEFHLYLRCSGKMASGTQQRAAWLDLALRDNNQTALIQRSNVLPVGERLHYDVSPHLYALKYETPPVGAALYRTWFSETLVVWSTRLKKLAEIRLSIDRENGELAGEMVDRDDNVLGTLAMACEAHDPDSTPKKF